MAKESEAFRDELSAILERFDDRHVLSVTEIAAYTGRSREWCRKHLGASGGMTAVQLARAMTRI